MILNVGISEISFAPFIDFSEIYDVNVELWHKDTKTKVTGSSGVGKVNSIVTLDLPDLTAIDDVAQEGDTILVRIYDLDAHLIWEYVATWISGETDLNANFKDWNTTNPNDVKWMRTS